MDTTYTVITERDGTRVPVEHGVTINRALACMEEYIEEHDIDPMKIRAQDDNDMWHWIDSYGNHENVYPTHSPLEAYNA